MARKPISKRYRAFFIRSEQFVTRTGNADSDFLYAAKNQHSGDVTWHRTYELARAAAGRLGEVTNALCDQIA